MIVIFEPSQSFVTFLILAPKNLYLFIELTSIFRSRENEDYRKDFGSWCWAFKLLYKDQDTKKKRTIDHIFSLQRDTNCGEKYKKQGREGERDTASTYIVKAQKVRLIMMHGRRVPEISRDRWTSNERWKKASALKTHEALMLLLIEGRVSDLVGFRAGTTHFLARNRRSRSYFSATPWRTCENSD